MLSVVSRVMMVLRHSRNNAGQTPRSFVERIFTDIARLHFVAYLHSRRLMQRMCMALIFGVHCSVAYAFDNAWCLRHAQQISQRHPTHRGTLKMPASSSPRISL